MDLDRKRASPTESAVMGDLTIGTLRSWYAEAALRFQTACCLKLLSVMSRLIRKHALNVLSGDVFLPAVISAAGGRGECLKAGGTAGIYDYINPVPEYVTVFRDGIFLFLDLSLPESKQLHFR